MQVRVSNFALKPREEITRSGISTPTKKSNVLQNFLKKTYFVLFLQHYFSFYEGKVQKSTSGFE